MASIWVPCPKTILVAGVGSRGRNSNQRQNSLFSCAPNQSPSGFKWPNGRQFAVTKLQAQLNEVAAKQSSNSAPVVDNKSKVALPDAKDESVEGNIPDAESISSFMKQASDLIKLVDSRDIVELQLKQLGCELIIRKKEALQQPPPAAPLVAVQPPYPQPMLATPPPVAALTPGPPSPTPAASAPALPPAPKASTSSHPPLKCPMAGTFYRCPAPGEPPFVKVGDKVQKGQVICIIEAMKLMNEIEADQSGTITEILVEDRKPVSVDMPLFVIAP